jgi:hypothetical protein
MANCNCGHDCKIECPGGCGCIYVHDTEECRCSCFKSTTGGSKVGLSLAAKIDISVSRLELGKIAAHLDRLTAKDVFVPASKVHKVVSLRMKNVPLRAAIKSLGLRT